MTLKKSFSPPPSFNFEVEVSEYSTQSRHQYFARHLEITLVKYLIQDIGQEALRMTSNMAILALFRKQNGSKLKMWSCDWNWYTSSNGIGRAFLILVLSILNAFLSHHNLNESYQRYPKVHCLGYWGRSNVYQSMKLQQQYSFNFKL